MLFACFILAGRKDDDAQDNCDSDVGNETILNSTSTADQQSSDFQNQDDDAVSTYFSFI